MNGTATRFLRLGVSLAGLVTLGWVLTGQAAKPVRHAVPTDWSHRHLIFSNPRSAEQARRVSEDPRYLQQVYRRQQRLALPSAAPDAVAGSQSSARRPFRLKKVMSEKLKRDWSRDLGSTGTVGAGNYPAKFSFDITTAFCDAATSPAQPDYTVFSTGLSGSLGQASVVAYDNLYNGCGGPTPMVYWAYNTVGQIRTSPVLSLDGTQVAFVQTTAGAGALVVLKWARGGTVSGPVAPSLVVPALYPACPAPCMTEIPLLAGGVAPPTDDTTSSVYYDYTNDVGWVGDASGWLHQITGMFKGTPTEVTGVFPVHVNAGSPLSSPVYDRGSNNVFVGDVGGFLYRVDATSGAVVTSGQLDHGVGIAEGPVVDSGNGFVYVFASGDGTTNCSGGPCSAVYQLSTTFAGGTSGTEVTVGASSATPNPLYIGGFDSAYYDSIAPSAATGNLYVCGNTGGPATLYQVPIQAGVLPAAGSAVTALATPASTAACSPVTDVPNEFLPGGFSERAFVSVQNDGLSSTCGSGGCVMNFVSAPWMLFTDYVVGQQVLSSQQHVETVITAGTSAGGPPTWSTQPAAIVTDGNPGPNQVAWIDQGSFAAPFLPWIASNTYGTPLIKILDPLGNVQVLTTTGTTGPTQPAWNTTPGLTTNDNTAVWTNVGALGTAALPAAGGTSGIIIDNTLAAINSSPGSQIYFSTLSDQACGTSGTGGCAVQASQPGLQ